MDGCRVIAGQELVIGFSFAGIGGTAVASREEALGAWARARDAGTPVVVFSEEVYGWVAGEVDPWAEGGRPPLVAVVPALAGPPGTGKSLATLIREAVGISC